MGLGFICRRLASKVQRRLQETWALHCFWRWRQWPSKLLQATSAEPVWSKHKQLNSRRLAAGNDDDSNSRTAVEARRQCWALELSRRVEVGSWGQVLRVRVMAVACPLHCVVKTWTKRPMYDKKEKDALSHLFDSAEKTKDANRSDREATCFYAPLLVPVLWSIPPLWKMFVIRFTTRTHSSK